MKNDENIFLFSTEIWAEQLKKHPVHVGDLIHYHAIQSNRRGNARAYGKITSNFISQANWRL